tara:strand:- start:944 stop:1375 length:432 start_codon:yes stop_codon:yes gene_type:complete
LFKKKEVNLIQLEKLSKKFAKKIKISDIVIFKGDLGSGKTTFIRYIINNIYLLNKKKPPKKIPSPSFPILQIYSLNKFSIYHYDFFRIKKVSEIDELGFEENILGNITFIEWPELIISKIYNYKNYVVEISISEEKIRKITIK